MKTLKVVVLLLVALMVIPIASGTRPKEASGTFSGAPPVLVEFRSAGENNITIVKVSFTVAGTFIGTCAGQERDVSRPSGVVTFQGTCNFEGTVAGKSGNATIRYGGLVKGDSGRGRFVVAHGTEGLEGLHAVGSFAITAPGTGAYQGRYHFDPSD